VALAAIGLLAVLGVGIAAWPDRGASVEMGPAPTVPAAAWDRAVASARSVNVNDAEAAELERLPRVGPALAQRIIEYRQRQGPFRTIEELEHVPGIGPKILEAIRPYVTVEAQQTVQGG